MKVSMLLCCSIALLILSTGCTTTRTSNTARTGLEQMLISNAVDQAISGTQFSSVYGKNVFVEEKYLDCTDKPYVIGTMRHRVLDAGGRLVDDVAKADIVMEVRSGGIGTDDTDKYVGLPGLAIPGVPLEIPEVRLWERNSQFGTAKIAIAAFDAKTGQQLESGSRLARSDNSRWSVLGFTTGDTGSVNRELAAISRQAPPLAGGNEQRSNEVIAAQPELWR